MKMVGTTKDFQMLQHSITLSLSAFSMTFACHGDVKSSACANEVSASKHNELKNYPLTITYLLITQLRNQFV